jgi:hypothetical protein
MKVRCGVKRNDISQNDMGGSRGRTELRGRVL